MAAIHRALKLVKNMSCVSLIAICVAALATLLSPGCRAGNTNNLWSFPDRIPVLCVAPNGGLLSFAEHRIQILSADSGYINATLRRSMDYGATWTPLQTIATDGTNTFSCGAVVVDAMTGKIFFFTGWSLAGDSEAAIDTGTSVDTKHIYVESSSDSGTNWTTPVDISSSVKQSNWFFCDPGPATGIQLPGGRLIVPWYYGLGTNASAPHSYPAIMYSDDHGATWKSSPGATNNPGGYSECSVVALTNGSLMMIARNDTLNPGYMGISISTDSGLTWSPMTNSSTLADSGCEGSAIRYTRPPAFGKSRLLFSNPPNSTLGDRAQVTVRVSYDEGSTWSVAKQYFPGLSAYSALTILPDGEWAILAENGTTTYYDQITFISDTLSDLTSGGDALDPATNSPAGLSLANLIPGILLTWPVSPMGYCLQSESALSAQGWTNVTGISPEIVNGENQLVLTATNCRQFFRLAAP